MNNAIKIGLMALVCGMAFHASQTNASINFHRFSSNPVNHCQAFTPGPANTIRNRVVGAENIGPAIAVACNFHSMSNGLASSDAPYQVTVYFANNSSGTITVTCTMLTGAQTSSNAYAVTKTTTPISAGGLTSTSLSWSLLDNPTPGASDMGNGYIGINCTLPTGAVINQTLVIWRQDNGVGT